MRVRLLIVGAVLLSLGGFSQQTYNLKEAIEYSLTNHPSTKIYSNEIDRVKFQTSEALSGYLPQISGKVSFDNNIERPTTMLPGAMFGQQKDLAVQMGQKYNSGASVQLDQTIYDQSLIWN